MKLSWLEYEGRMIGYYVAKGLADAASAKTVLAGLWAVVMFTWPSDRLQESALGLFVLVMLDSVTGVIGSVASGVPLQSRRASRLALKLIAYWAVCSVIAISARHIDAAESMGDAPMVLVIGWLMAAEIVSIVENLRRMGVRLPKQVTEYLDGRAQALGQKEQGR